MADTSSAPDTATTPRPQPSPCPSCGGRGWVVSTYTMPDGRTITQTEPCGDCRGRDGR